MASGKQLAKNLKDAIAHRAAIWDEVSTTCDTARYKELSAHYPGSIQFEARKAVGDHKEKLAAHIQRVFGVSAHDLETMLRA
jgi:hypothetical protein